MQFYIVDINIFQINDNSTWLVAAEFAKTYRILSETTPTPAYDLLQSSRPLTVRSIY